MTNETKHTPGPREVSLPEKGQDGYPHNLSIVFESPTRAAIAKATGE